MREPGAGWATQKNKKFSSCLCKATDLPSWHFKHRALIGGYRKSPASFAEACLSLFYWHNESINIWLHYLGPIIIVLFTLHITDNGNIILNRGTNIDHVFFFGCVVAGNILPLVTSAICHQFYYMNKKVHEVCWFLDFTGIIFSAAVAGITFVYFCFYCNPNMMILCTSTYFLGAIICYVKCWKQYDQRVMSREELDPCDRFPEFIRYMSIYGLSVSISEILLVLLLEREYIFDPLYRWIVVQTWAAVGLMTVAVIIFAKGGVPEVLCRPLGLRMNYFDMIGHSHQFWHLFAVIAMLIWIHILVDHYKARVYREC